MMVKKRTITFLILLLLFPFLVLFPVCGASALTVKTVFTREEFLADYDQLWIDLEENYPFFSVLKRRGIDVDSLRNSNRKVLSSRIKDLNGFVYVLNDTFRRMDNFGHLSLVGVELFSFYSEYPACQTSGKSNPRDVLVFNPQTEATYKALGFPDETFTDKEFPEVVAEYLPEIKAAYFHFKSFNKPLFQEDQNIIINYLSSLQEVNHIIIDITGNTGGFTGYWIHNIFSPFEGNYEWVNYSFLQLSPINKRYLKDSLSDIKPLSELPVGYILPPFVDELNFTHFYEDRNPLFSKNYTGSKIKSTAKRWLLIDQRVFSAADHFAAFCKASGWATVVGKTTFGDGASTFRPVVMALPNTGLLVRFSSTAAANEDGTLNVEIGTSPDIACLKRETPLEACLRTIANLN